MLRFADLSSAEQDFEREVWGRRTRNVPEDELRVAYATGRTKEQRLSDLRALRAEKAKQAAAKASTRVIRTTTVRRKRSPRVSFDHLLTLGDRHRAAALGVAL